MLDSLGEEGQQDHLGAFSGAGIQEISSSGLVSRLFSL